MLKTVRVSLSFGFIEVLFLFPKMTMIFCYKKLCSLIELGLEGVELFMAET